MQNSYYPTQGAYTAQQVTATPTQTSYAYQGYPTTQAGGVYAGQQPSATAGQVYNVQSTGVPQTQQYSSSILFT